LIFGAIDIGSNAGRLLIGSVKNGNEEATVKKIMLVRVPLRLGEDVFEDKRISKKRIKMLIKTLKAYRHLMDVYEVETFRAVATSAMREAENKKEVLEAVRQETGINLELIEGEEEADLILSNFFTQKIDHKKSYLYIDVGGGSTEISLIENGKKMASQSFKMGTLRILKNQVPERRWIEMKEWVKTLNPNHTEIIAVGTGGNINRILKIHERDDDYITYAEIKKIQAHLASFTLEDRINILGLRPDRADVILPAADIYLAIMKYAEVTQMLVPKIGLSDGIIFDLYKKSKKAVLK
jgi:exopolyphosphatase/guanosine-5'-triphosphate,3'-diphosphate pyrophosphatase